MVLNVEPESNDEETPDIPKLKDIPPQYYPIISKNHNVLKSNEA